MNDQLAREPVDAGRNRGMRRENGAARLRSNAVSKSSPFCMYSRNPLHPEEPGVTLVGVEHRWRAPVIRQYARMARTPPMPSSTSCSSRWSVPPPYSRSVTSRS